MPAMNVSLPSPPEMESLPDPSNTVSAPSPAMIVSLPPRAKIILAPPSPVIVFPSFASPMNDTPVLIVSICSFVPFPRAAWAGLKRRTSTNKSCVPMKDSRESSIRFSRLNVMVWDVSLPLIKTR